MFTLTITLKSTEHQIVLSFKERSSKDIAGRCINSMAEDKAEFTQVEDDYGQLATWKTDDLLSTVTTDVVAFWEGKNVNSMIKIRANHSFEIGLSKDPQLHFLSGNKHPAFGGDR